MSTKIQSKEFFIWNCFKIKKNEHTYVVRLEIYFINSEPPLLITEGYPTSYEINEFVAGS